MSIPMSRRWRIISSIHSLSEVRYDPLCPSSPIRPAPPPTPTPLFLLWVGVLVLFSLIYICETYSACYPFQGALVYFIRRVLHDWTDEISVGILQNVVAAMTPESRVVINEFLVPEVAADAETCWVDLVMLTFAGTERTAPQFEAILDAAGLKLTEIYSSPKTHYVSCISRWTRPYSCTIVILILTSSFRWQLRHG